MIAYIYDADGLLCKVEEELNVGSIVYITYLDAIEKLQVHEKSYSIDITRTTNGIAHLNANLHVRKYD